MNVAIYSQRNEHNGGVILRKVYQEDLKYIYEKLSEHPLFIIEESKKAVFDALFYSLNDRVIDYDAFINAINRLTGFFCDGHTNMEIPYSSNDKALNIPCYWCGGKLLLKTDYMGVQKGAQIVAVEHKTVDEIVLAMADRIPHENLFLVKSRMINYPYKNYHLFSEMTLRFLFGVQDEYTISFALDGQTVEKSLKLEEYNGYLDFADDDFIYYEIEGDTAILHLDSCICNEFYKNTLCELADVCHKNKISTLILDLSKNMGGSSAVIDAFIKHTNTSKYRRYEMIDYSSGKPEHITKRTELVKNSPHSKCFDLDIQCRVSYDTFSSARTFAVTLKDNKIATKIIGMPTGGKPSSFGMPQRWRTPNCSIPFRVSRCLFLRPDRTGDAEIALYPD